MLTIAPQAFLDALPEPALLVRRTGDIIAANAAFRAAVPPLADARDIRSTDDLAVPALDLLRRCGAASEPVSGELGTLAVTGALVGSEAPDADAVILVRGSPVGSGAALDAIAQRDLTIRELNHRAKNNLQLLLSLFLLGERAETDPKVKDKLRDARLRIQAMAKVQKLLHLAESGTAIDAGDFLRELCEGVVAAYAPPTLALRVEALSVRLSLEAAVPLGLIVNELLSNTCKHASATAIDLTMRRSGEGFELEVGDDGIGFVDKPNESSLGLRLTRGLVQQLQGTMTLVQTKPARWRITFSDPGKKKAAASPA